MATSMKFSEILSRLNGISTPPSAVCLGPRPIRTSRWHDGCSFSWKIVVSCTSHMRSRIHVTVLLRSLRSGAFCQISWPLEVSVRTSAVLFARCARHAGDSSARPAAVGPRRAEWGFDDVWRGPPSWEFNQALGAMRGVFGLHIAQIAVRYRIDVSDPLDQILPAMDSD
jgi:hypothetical protein